MGGQGYTKNRPKAWNEFLPVYERKLLYRYACVTMFRSNKKPQRFRWGFLYYRRQPMLQKKQLKNGVTFFIISIIANYICNCITFCNFFKNKNYPIQFCLNKLSKALCDSLLTRCAYLVVVVIAWCPNTFCTTRRLPV